MNRSLTLAAASAALLLAACPGKKSDTTPPPPPPPPPVNLTTFQDASLAIGQAGLTVAAAPTCSASSLNQPYGAAAWDGTRLFVPDTDGNRVHAYVGIPTAGDAAPSFDLGQADCAPAGSVSTSASELAGPQSVVAHGAGTGGKLVVADANNNRVLVFSGIPSSGVPSAPPAAATLAIGQADLTTWGGTCGATALNNPQSAFVTPAGKLIVADYANNRVLVWSSIPTSNVQADLVLGQVSKTTCNANDDGVDPPADVNAKTLSHPTDVWSDDTRLVVVDSWNNRVLVWNTFPATDGTANGKAADAVIGQVGFTTTASGTTDKALAGPIAVASDGNALFVADAGNNRVLVLDAIPSTGAGAVATKVLGQGTFTGSAANDGAPQDGVSDANPSANTLNYPTGLAVIDGALFVTDSHNHRVLVFRPPTP